MIVVVGIFAGLQVTEWNDERKERIVERALLSRLHVETRALLSVLEEELAVLQLRAEVLIGINPVLFNQEPSRAINGLECRIIVGSHVYRRPADDLPVLNEMRETGRFDLLQETEIKDALRDYLRLSERSRAHWQEATNELFRLHSRYPEMIAIRRTPVAPGDKFDWGGLSGEGYRWAQQCDVGKMRQSTRFLNEYVDNLSRINTAMSLATMRQEHLRHLESLLEQLVAD